jgi:hypothetical protein
MKTRVCSACGGDPQPVTNFCGDSPRCKTCTFKKEIKLNPKRAHVQFFPWVALDANGWPTNKYIQDHTKVLR